MNTSTCLSTFIKYVLNFLKHAIKHVPYLIPGTDNLEANESGCPLKLSSGRDDVNPWSGYNKRSQVPELNRLIETEGPRVREHLRKCLFTFYWPGDLLSPRGLWLLRQISGCDWSTGCMGENNKNGRSYVKNKQKQDKKKTTLHCFVYRHLVFQAKKLVH